MAKPENPNNDDVQIQIIDIDSLKCNAEGNFWSMGPNSRCYGVPRTSTRGGVCIIADILVIFVIIFLN